MKLKSEFNFKDWQKFAGAMLDRANAPMGYLSRVVYPQILEIQSQRWQSENTTQGKRWAPLNPEYAKRKLKRYAAYPGGGRKMLIATGALVESMIAQDLKYHYKYVSNRELKVGTTLAYAKWVNEKRDITSLKPGQVKGFAKGLSAYIVSGVAK